MVKLGRGYLRMKKWVLYVDRENGKEEMMEGFIEWCMNKSKKELQWGEYDKVEGKDVGKVGRFGVEVVVERVGGMIRDWNYIREVIMKLRKEGINIKVVMVDYGGKVG